MRVTNGPFCRESLPYPRQRCGWGRQARVAGAPRAGSSFNEGHELDEATLSRISPYLTEHVNRFGKYTLNLDRTNPSPDYTISPRP